MNPVMERQIAEMVKAGKLTQDEADQLRSEPGFVRPARFVQILIGQSASPPGLNALMAGGTTWHQVYGLDDSGNVWSWVGGEIGWTHMGPQPKVPA